MIRIFLFLAVAVSLFASDKREFAYRKTEKQMRPVTFWMKNGKPVSLKAQEILTEDSEKGFFLIQNPQANKINYSLRDSSGGVLSRFSRVWDSDLPLPKVLIDAQRKRIISLDISGRLLAKTFTGDLLWQRILIDHPVFTYENTYAAYLNETSGEITAAVSQPQQEGDPRRETRLFIISPEGVLVSARIFKNTQLLKMDMNADGSRTVLMVLSSPNNKSRKRQIRTFVLDQAQKILWESNFQYRRALFADGDHLLLTGKNKARFINIKNGQILWELKETERIFDSAVLTKDGFAALLSGRPEYVDGKLFYRDTHFYQTDCFNYHLWQTVIPEAAFIPGNIYQDEQGNWSLGGRFGVYRVPGLEDGK